LHTIRAHSMVNDKTRQDKTRQDKRQDGEGKSKEISKAKRLRRKWKDKVLCVAAGGGWGGICVSHGIPSAHTGAAFAEQPCSQRLGTPSSSRKIPRPPLSSLSLAVAQATPRALTYSPFSTLPLLPQSTWPPSQSTPWAHSVQANLRQGGRGGAGVNSAISECLLLAPVLRCFHISPLISPLISRSRINSISMPSLFPKLPMSGRSLQSLSS
jgi:hypothetical protein